jgi:hypothetical protein
MCVKGTSDPNLPEPRQPNKTELKGAVSAIEAMVAEVAKQRQRAEAVPRY